MLCETCLTYGGDTTDNTIRFITNHHPSCPDFSIDKELFLTHLQCQVEIGIERKFESELPILRKILEKEIRREQPVEVEKEERLSSKIIRKLYSNLCSRYFPIVPNSYVYAWESDLLAISKTNYATEYEVKISRNDFKADFKKDKKHQFISDAFKYKFSSYELPNYFYYATPPGLLNKSEIPPYAGLIEVGIGVSYVKRAPVIHKLEVESDFTLKLLKKTYYKYWG